MTPESIRQRSDLLGTMIVTRNTGKRLGIVSQLWVDIDRREVIGFGVKDSILAVSALPRFMALDSISQIGDVILVEDDRAIEDAIDTELYSTLIGSEVITETGELLGKVRGFKFDVEDGRVTSIIIASIALPQIPDQAISTYELGIDEVVSSGPDRLIVFEGAESRLIQLSVGVLERLGITSPPWEREDEDLYFTPSAAPGNQLGTGLRQETAVRDRAYGGNEAWDEDEWTEADPAYGRSRRQEAAYEEPYYGDRRQDEYDYEETYEDVEADAWADEEAPQYQAPKLNIPEKTRQRQPEYEDGY
ncbi:MAG: PRC-barrel domain-containing protein [Cyanophyceae cyanobacterium]